MPDILITSLGTEIYYAPQLIADIAWTYPIDHLWMPHALRRIFAGLPGLTPQAKSEQSRFKLSYHYDSNAAPPMEEILTLLRQQELPANPIFSFGQFFDIVPAWASRPRLALHCQAVEYSFGAYPGNGGAAPTKTCFAAIPWELSSPSATERDYRYWAIPNTSILPSGLMPGAYWKPLNIMIFSISSGAHSL